MQRFSIGILAALLGATAANAQTNARQEAEEAIAACLAISVEPVRAACLQAATDYLNGLPAEAPTPKPIPDESVPPAPVTPEPTPPVPQSNTAEIEAELKRLAEAREALEEERAALEAERTELAKAAEAEAEEAPSGGLFSRGERRRLFFVADELPKEVEVTIEKITINRRTNLHTFYTAEGEVMRQADVRQRLKPPSSLPAKATVERRTLGAKWLIFDEHPNRSLKVSILDLD